MSVRDGEKRGLGEGEGKGGGGGINKWKMT